MSLMDSAYGSHRSPDFTRLPMAGLLCALGLLAGVALAWAQSPPDKSGTYPSADGAASQLPPADKAKANPNDSASHQEDDRPIREGTEVVDQPGSFKLVGDRALFLTNDGKHRWCTLENLGLERIVRTVADSPEQLEWNVTGTITEYRGNNYLLIRRASLRNRAPLRGENPSAFSSDAVTR